jgi:hypothetical protein
MEDEKPSLTLDAYFIPQKVAAFMHSYAPCTEEAAATDVFNDARLRHYFQAYPISGLGDLLIPYLDALEAEGFLLQTSITGEPAIFVTGKPYGNSSFMLALSE